MKQWAAEHLESKKALNSPPHITLLPPFKYDQKRVDELLIPLYEVAAKTSAFYLTMNGFAHFSNKVIFVDLEKEEALYTLQKLLTDCWVTVVQDFRSSKRFYPHATLAFRDLSPDNFNKGWAHFEKREYLRVFQVKDFHLLKHNGKVWEPMNRFSLEV